MRLRKLAIAGQKTLQGSQNFRTARTYLSFIGAPELDRLP